jgi:hypothetical protein
MRFTAAPMSVGNALDSACKLEKPKVTKHSTLNNPWITESIITAVDRKHALKDDWIKSINKEAPEGNFQLCEIFSNYRRVLKYVINSAKHLYDCNRISEHKTDRQIINELRGKSKKSVKPSIVIDNKKITDRRIIANHFSN